jgi:general secretion pathway protein G
MFERALRKHRSGEEGFTLIELLIVIIILGILAAVVVFAVGGIQDRGQTSACEAERKTLEVAVEAYFAKNGSYPANAAAMTAAPNKFLHDAPENYDTSGGNITGTCP